MAIPSKPYYQSRESFDPCQDFTNAYNNSAFRKSINEASKDTAAVIEQSGKGLMTGLIKSAEIFDLMIVSSVEGVNVAVDGINYFTGNIQFLIIICVKFLTGGFWGFLQFIAAIIGFKLDPEGHIGIKPLVYYISTLIILFFALPVIAVVMLLIDSLFNVIELFT